MPDCKILILGGYGTFGGRLAQLLDGTAGLRLVIAGRSAENLLVLEELAEAEGLDLVPTAGSDYHGEQISPDRHFGDVTMPAEQLARLEARRP